ncbi:MAG: hypothetical protein CBB60_004430 [Armatimonadetes bacterium Cent15-Ar3]|nr:MAG: hypothetical protein CBB60_004430 [Armatimonadetes bacterium Cent15-Ar3]
MNPINIQNEVEHLRAEKPREGAKGELIYKLTHSKGNKMTTLRKATLPTLVTAVALLGGVMLMQPKAVAATPKTVAAALKKAMNYTIQSFVGEGSSRRMQSVTTVEGEKKTTKFVDSKGNLVDQDVHFETLMGKDGSVTVKGLPSLNGKTIVKRKTIGSPEGKTVKGLKITINDTNVYSKGVKTIKVDGKELQEIPKELEGKIKFSDGGVVAGMEIMGDLPKDSQTVIAVLGSKDGKPMILQSGQTPSQYLMDLLQDEMRWNITRGVTYNGQKLDKFGLKVKGDFTPVELYIDPASALPKYLVFKGMDGMGMKIEDVYTYGAKP